MKRIPDISYFCLPFQTTGNWSISEVPRYRDRDRSQSAGRSLLEAHSVKLGDLSCKCQTKIFQGHVRDGRVAQKFRESVSILLRCKPYRLRAERRWNQFHVLRYLVHPKTWNLRGVCQHWNHIVLHRTKEPSLNTPRFSHSWTIYLPESLPGKKHHLPTPVFQVLCLLWAMCPVIFCWSIWCLPPRHWWFLTTLTSSSCWFPPLGYIQCFPKLRKNHILEPCKSAVLLYSYTSWHGPISPSMSVKNLPYNT